VFYEYSIQPVAAWKTRAVQPNGNAIHLSATLAAGLAVLSAKSTALEGKTSSCLQS
jgi:hypothetical protein